MACFGVGWLYTAKGALHLQGQRVGNAPQLASCVVYVQVLPWNMRMSTAFFMHAISPQHGSLCVGLATSVGDLISTSALAPHVCSPTAHHCQLMA